MDPASHERELLTRYLLGDLPEEERPAVSDRILTEAPFAEALEDTERDLLDAYARGHLDRQDRTAVESRLLNSERQREKLIFSQALAARSTPRQRQAAHNLLLWVVAAALIIGAVGMLRQAFDGSPATGRIAPAPTTAAKPPAHTPEPVFAALLTPGALRDGEVQEVRLPQKAPSVRFDLLLDPPASPGVYSVRLVRAREAVFEQAGLGMRVEAGMPLVSVVIPSAVLSPGAYRLFAIQNQRESPYFFRIS